MKPVLEKIPIGQAQTILAFEHRKKDFETPWHFHPQHELTLIEESVGTKFVGDFVGNYQPRELVLLRSNLPHYWKNQPNESGLARSVVIQWNEDVFAKTPELTTIFTMLKVAARGLVFGEKITEKVYEYIKQLPQKSGGDLYIGLLSILLQLSMSTYTTLSRASFEQDLSPEYSTRMSKIHDFINANFHRKIYLKEVADLINMTEQSFARFFKKMMGRSFFTFLNEYRINQATRLLLDTDWTVATVGYQCGFESLPFFYQQFNKYQQISPLKYRKQFLV
ncbi:MAG: AraC family transcriptional regulator [Bacteroidota bacterium]